MVLAKLSFVRSLALHVLDHQGAPSAYCNTLESRQERVNQISSSVNPEEITPLVCDADGVV
eukprot:2213191-Amphidinium_carterae.1